MKLHELSVKRPVLVSMIVLIFVIIGLYSVSMLPMELMPEMDTPVAIVMTNYSNVGAEEVENLVTERIESACASISGIDTMQSQSSEGLSLVVLQFYTGTDMDEAVTDVEDSIDLISDYLPEDCDDPMVIKLDMNSATVAMMSVGYEGYDLVQTKQFVEDYVQDKLESVEGVASVSVMGAKERVIEVEVDPDKLHGYGLSPSDIAGAIGLQNTKLPAGSTVGMNKNMSVRVIGEFEEVSEIENVPITLKTGQIIYVSDIATVKDTFSDDSTIARLDGENAISISISAESDANTVDVVDGITKALEQLKTQYPKFTYNVTMETASVIEDSVSSVAESAVTGGLLAVLVLLLFLGNIKTSLVIGVAMPVSVITTFVGMYFAGMTLNVVSLGGLALGVGMLVDNAVVVIENIVRRRKEFGDDSEKAAVSGTGEVIGAVVASVITTCIVYVPIMFIDNMMADVFKQLAFTIVFSQISSMLITFLIVPMLSARIKNMDERNKKLSFILVPFEKLMNAFYRVYEKGLRWVLVHRKRFLLAVIALFAVSIFSLVTGGLELMPTSDEGTVSVSIELPAGSKIESTDKLSKSIEEKIKTLPDVETVFANIGSAGMMSLGSNDNNATITVTLLEDRKKSTDDVVQEIRDLLSDVTGATIEVSSSSAGMSMSTNELSYNFSSNDEKALEEYVLKAEEVLKGIDGVSETSTSISETQPEIRINIDNAKAAKYGLSTTAVSAYVGAVLDGTTASRFTESGSEYDINIVYPENYITDYTKLETMQIKTAVGQWITLGDVAKISVEQGSTTLSRVNQKRVITLSGVLHGTDMGTANKEFEKAIASLEVPEGVTREATGVYEMMIEAMIQFILAIILGIVLMYLVMCAQFENMRQPFIILFTVPLSLIGVALSIILTGSNLSVLSFIGMLMLVGIIVNNAILLIEFINQKKIECPDMERDEIVVQSGITRLRPILMTTLTSVIGFFPMAVAGSEMMQPLAVVLLGGLGVGALLTLLVIPTIYTIMDDRQIKNKEKRAKKAARAEFKHAVRKRKGESI